MGILLLSNLTGQSQYKLQAGGKIMQDNMPLGFAFQLSMNENAMRNFANMTEDEKIQTLRAARSAESREKMQGIVDDISKLG